MEITNLPPVVPELPAEMPAEPVPELPAKSDCREQARQTYQDSLTAELPLTGAALGRMFGKSDRWGRDRIAEVRSGFPNPTGAYADSAVPELPAARPETPAEMPAHVPAKRGDKTATVPVAVLPEKTAAASETAVPAITTAAVVLVAAVAAVISYAHMRDLAKNTGEGWRAVLLPLAVDGLLVAAALSMLVRRRQGKRATPLAWISLVLGISASLAANIAAAAPTLEGRVVAAWPPVALALAFELLMQQVRDTREER